MPFYFIITRRTIGSTFDNTLVNRQSMDTYIAKAAPNTSQYKCSDIKHSYIFNCAAISNIPSIQY